MTTVLAAIFLLFVAMICRVQKMPGAHIFALELAAAGSDEDMKIAGGGFSRPFDTGDGAEDAARQFLLEKDAGNIEKARALGKLYANALRGLEAGGYHTPGSAELETHHRLLLCSYAVNRVITERSPNSIIAHTSLNVFYDAIEAESPALYTHISDMAALSLYILSGREGGSDAEIGGIYAKLCGFEGDKVKTDEGGDMYRSFYKYCADEMDKAGYENIALPSL